MRHSCGSVEGSKREGAAMAGHRLGEGGQAKGWRAHGLAPRTFCDFLLFTKYSSFLAPTWRRRVTSGVSVGRRSSELSSTIST